jgi:DNA-binding transcriptional MerR regulator
MMLENKNDFIHETDIKVEDIVKEQDMRIFFIEDIDKILSLYSPGKLENKPDVIEHIDKLKREREALIKKNIEDMEKVEAYKKIIMNSKLLKR